MVDIRLYPSVLSADFVNMEAELHRIASADAVHVDVMDNHFVEALFTRLRQLTMPRAT